MSVLQASKQVIVWVFSRSLLWVAVFFFLGLRLVDHELIRLGVEVKVLRQISSAEFKNLLDIPQKTTDKRLLYNYLYFFRKTTEYFPNKPEGYALRGFVHYYYGEQNEAIKYYLKAIEKKPDYFWNYFNLGTIYFKEGELKNALDYYKAAISQEKKTTLAHIEDSQFLYKQILQFVTDPESQIDLSFDEGKKVCYYLVCLISFQLKDFNGMEIYAQEAIQQKLRPVNVFQDYQYIARLSQNEPAHPKVLRASVAIQETIQFEQKRMPLRIF